MKAGLAKGKAKKVLGFKNGTQTFLNAIAKELGNERVILNTKVEKLKLSDGFVEINSELKAKQVILATDASASADLIKFIDLDLANNISKVKYSPLGLIHLVAKQNSNFGAGFLSVGKRATLGVLCSSNAFEGRAPEDSLLLTCFVGGAKNPELADVRDSKIEELVIREVVETLKLESSPQIINKVFWKNAIPNYELGHFKLQEMVECYNQSDNRVKLFGSWLNGAGIGKIIENARRFSSSLKCLN